MSPSLLVVDDDTALLSLLAAFFEKRGWRVSRAATGAAALERCEADDPDLVLLDLDLPDLTGLAVLQRLRERDPDLTVVMLTGHGDIEVAVEAMRAGAENFLTKPLELEHLAAAMDRAAEKAALRRRNRVLSHAAATAPAPGGEMGASPLMRGIADQIDRIASGDATVLLQGETGTGKGWVARRIHDRSARARAPFVEVNCAGLTATFLDSELFGHEQGAFTDARALKHGLFEVADGGTIFLDEVGDLVPELQPKLLKAIETRRFRRLGGTREIAVDVRLIAATNRDLRELVDAGRFRRDLYFRLAVLPLELPPLRDRPAGDIADLAYRLLDQLRRAVGTGPERFRDDALERLARHDWPGNIRELRNVLERVLILNQGAAEIRPEHLPPDLRSGAAPAPASTNGAPLTLDEVERRHLIAALERHHGNRARVARELGISRTSLYDRIGRYGLEEVGRA